MRHGWIAAIGLLGLGAFVSGCYAKHHPLEGATPSPRATSALPVVAGVVVAETGADDNARRVAATEVVQEFARHLEAAHLFERVVFPYTPLSQVAAQVVIEVRVTSRVDERFWWNLLTQSAVGASLGTLQPLLPQSCDLDIQLTARLHTPEGDWAREHQHRSRYRFETTWVQAREADLRAWRRAAEADAAARLVQQMIRDGALRELASRGVVTQQAAR
jgi:hypothetical protein